jgi:hypothetical protein
MNCAEVVKVADGHAVIWSEQLTNGREGVDALSAIDNNKRKFLTYIHNSTSASGREEEAES